MGGGVASVARAWLADLISSAINQHQAGPESTPRKQADGELLLSPPFTVSPSGVAKRPQLEHELEPELGPEPQLQPEPELEPEPEVQQLEPEPELEQPSLAVRLGTPMTQLNTEVPSAPSLPHDVTKLQAARALAQDNVVTTRSESLHKRDMTTNLTASISCLPPLDELEQVTRANLKAMRQVRRGLRKARKSLEQAPIQQEVARRAGEVAGTTLVERLRRDALRRELRTGGLSSQVEWPGWRAHVALEEPGGAAGDVVLTPAIAAAHASLKTLADTTDFRPQRTGGAALSTVELQSRVAAARAAISGDLSTMCSRYGGKTGSAALVGAITASVSALRWATGDAAEARINETWLHCKVIGDGEHIDEVLVLICEGPLAGETVIVEQNSHLRAVDSGVSASGVRLAQAQQAYDELQKGVAESYSSLSESDRKILDQAISELREAVETLMFHEKHGREHVPLELARFMRMRVGLIRRRGRGRSRRSEMNDDRRYPICGRCAKRARGCEDTTNGSWYCHPCWAEWESGHQLLQLETASPSDAEHLGINLGRVVPGSWIRGSCSSASIAAGATIVEQRRTIADLQSEVATLKRYRRELEEGYLESAELFDQLEGTQAAVQRLDAIEANIRQEQAWREKRESDAQPTVQPNAARPRMRYNRRAVFGRNAVVAPAGDSLTEHAVSRTGDSAKTDASQREASDTKPSSFTSGRPDHTSDLVTGLPPSSLRTAMVGTSGAGVGSHRHASRGLLLAQTYPGAF